MRVTHEALGFFLLLFASVNADLSHGLCSPHGEHGVDCSTLEDVKKLKNIHDLNILKVSPTVQVIPAETFRSFDSLTHLDLSDGILRRIEPGSFFHLSNLLHLNLADNEIRNIKLGTFKGLNRLVSLNLRKNAIRHLTPELLNLKSLQSLDLAGNPLECNCASCRIRDALVKRNVKVSKKALCAGPAGVKGVSFLKPQTNVICLLDKSEKDMQMDQPMLNDEEGSGANDDEEDYEDYDKLLEETTDKKVVEVETPVPKLEATMHKSNSTTTAEEIFFDSEDGDKKSKNVTINNRDAFEEGSGGFDEEGSGIEGSGLNLVPHIDWKQIQEEENNTEDSITPSSEPSSTTHSEGFLDMLFNALWTTSAPEEKKMPELEEEEFLVLPTSSAEDKSEPRSGVNENTPELTTRFVKLSEAIPTKESEQMVNANEDQNEKLNESLSHPSKKGMGSYLVLAALLAILAGLIAFAAYKGDFCRSKRKQSDVEDGTELKDMQKSLLEQNNVSPKVASNGNTEIVPLMSNKDEDRRIPENGNSKKEDTIDGCDPVKPPRKSMNLDDRAITNGTSHHEQMILDGSKPPVSPGAQRVKITLQENPDSVPKTPVLITRLKPDDNLVKTP